jgi:hypothetical protein
MNASTILLSNASVLFETDQNRLFGAEPLGFGGVSVVIIYGTITTKNSEPLSRLNIGKRFLQIGNLTLPGIDPWTFCVSLIGSFETAQCFKSDLTGVKSFIVSVSNIGNVFIEASNGVFAGFLSKVDGSGFFEVSEIYNFVDEARFSFFTNTPTPTPSGTSISSLNESSNIGLIVGLIVLGVVVIIAVRTAYGVVLIRRGRREGYHQQYQDWESHSDEMEPETNLEPQSDVPTLSSLTGIVGVGNQNGKHNQFKSPPGLWDSLDGFSQTDENP